MLAKTWHFLLKIRQTIRILLECMPETNSVGLGPGSKNKGYNVQCPGHADCSANYSKTVPFSEFVAGEELGKQAIAQRILISHVTTDGDGRSADGVAEAFSLVDPLLTVARQDDPAHLGQTQFRRCLKTVFSPNMFGEESTLSAEEKKLRHKLFSLDIKSRCHCIFERLFSYYNGNVTAISKRLELCVENMLNCYSGNHSKCARSHVCCSGGKTNNWFCTSYYLKNLGISNLVLTRNDKALLTDIIDLKLSVEGVKSLHLHSNTNKNEAANRSVSVSLPKNVNFSRNFSARVHSTAHRINLGTGDSLIQKLEFVGAPISKGGAVAKSVAGMQVQSQYHKKYSKRKDVKKRCSKSKDNEIKEYLKVKLFKKNPIHTYAKAQLHRKPKSSLPEKCKAPSADHEYAKK